MYGKYLVLFAIIFTGWALRKINFIDDKMNHSMNKLIVYFTYPCMIVHNIGTIEMSGPTVRDFLIAFGLSLACFYLYGFMGKGYGWLLKFPKADSPVYESTMMMPNDGFMGFSMALLFFGEKGLLLMLAHNAAFNICMFTYNIAIMRKGTERAQKMSFRTICKALARLIVNPNIIALVVGFAVSLLPCTLPGPVDEYLLYLGNVSTPMAMIYIGSTLSRCSFGEIFKDIYSIEASVYKLIITPVVTGLIVYFLPIPAIIKAIVVLGTTFPTATTACMLAEQEGLNEKAATRVMFMSTLFSIPIIPLMVKLVNLVFMV